VRIVSYHLQKYRPIQATWPDRVLILVQLPFKSLPL
jgi:hypothetical protein